jgi:hypothetical protein
MKKPKLTFLLLFISMHLLAPPPDRPTFIIPESEVVNYYDSVNEFEPLIKAVVHWESRGDTLAHNELENAVGAFQIRQCRIDHYNKLNGTSYTLEDCYDYDLSKRVFLFFAEGKSWEKAAKDWNGSGPMTLLYWENVKKLI